jgi:predicted metal-dependent hydrolase
MKLKIDKIIKSKRRTIALEITRDALLVVRAPLRTPNRFIEKAVEEKRDWVLKKQSDVLARDEKHPPKHCAEGETFELLGKEYALSFQNGVSQIYIDGGRLLVPQSLKGNAQLAITGWYKEQAYRTLRERVDYFAAKAGVRYASLKITSALTRWGSCSAGGRLCFTWRLAMAPVDKIDYVVAHELSHIGHPDHSSAFWRRVAELMPDYAPRREWFKQNAALLRRDFFAE